MSLQDQIPVPEVDELRLARMERRLVAEVATLPDSKNSSHRRLVQGLVGFVAVAGVILAIALNLQSATAPQLPASVARTATLHTGPGQEDRLILGDATVLVSENTQVDIDRFDDGRTLLRLEEGTVLCEVEPRPNRPTFEVLAGDTRVTVIGTVFSVARHDGVTVVVERGVVRVATNGEELHLHAGERWTGAVRAGRLAAAPLAEDAAAKPAEVAKGPEAADAGVSPGPGKRRRKRSAEPAGAKLRDVLKGANPIRPVPLPSHGERAAELLRVSSTKPKQAVRELGALGARAVGNEASFALYSRAYLLYFKLGERRSVVTAAKQYERRFPKGREAEDMLWLRVRASCDGSSYSSACRAAAHTYRRRFPSGVFDALAAKIIRSPEAAED